MRQVAEQRQIEDAAAAWIARLAAHDSTPQDRAQFETWLKEPAHRTAFGRMAALWSQLGAVAVAQCRAKPISAKPSHRLLPFALAATMLMAISGWLLMTQPTVIGTDVGEQREVALGDGSRIELNTRTRIELAYGDPQRQVAIREGEAFFDVVPDPGRPFTVTTPHGVVTVLGTAFNVRVTGTDSVVSVTEGRVRVANASEDRVLGAREAASVGSVGAPIAIARSENGSWRYGRLDYVDVTLAELIEDLNRYVPVRMALVAGTSTDERINASLRLEDQADMLRALTEILPLRFSRVSDDLILLQAGS